MRFFVTGRRMGKTTRAFAEALMQSETQPVCFLAFNKSERDRLRETYHKELSASKLEVFSLEELQFLSGMRRFRKVYIDNADMILMRFFHKLLDSELGGGIELVTATGEPVRDMAIIKAGAVEMWREAIRIVLDMHEKEEAQSLAPLLVMKFRQKIYAITGVKEGEDNVRPIRNQGTNETSAGAAAGSEPTEAGPDQS